MILESHLLFILPYILVIGLVLILIGYYFLFYQSFQKIIDQDVSYVGEKPFVSIIVCAKNAGAQLRKTILSLLSQKYSHFEVIVVNDFSSDDSFKVLSEINDNRLIMINAKEDKPGKKAALTTGVDAAKGPLLLMTDADCTPASSNWVESMVSTMMRNSQCEIVLGYGPMKVENNWVNKFSRFETALTAMQYISYAVFGRPYMGVGRNLMYKKSLWQTTNGFESHKNITSGDDDLFIMQAAHKNNTQINLQPEAFVFSESKNNWVDFFRQKNRHISTSFYYSWFHKISLAIFSGTHLLFWVLGTIFVFVGLLPFYHFLMIILFKWVIQMSLSQSIFKKLQTQKLMKWYPLLDIQLSIFYLIVGVLSIFRNNKW